MGEYYVYVYIDPRNYEEFYYGKGQGSRKDAHLREQSDSAKVKRINDILKEGQKPIIRVIASGLTEPEALLVEKTLLWKLKKFTTNVSSGHFADKFRPHNTLHRELPGFDFKNGFYYYNVGECEYRNWDDYRTHGIIAAGGNCRWRDAICGFNVGDIFAAYLKRRGFVGVGKILTRAKPIDDELLKLPLAARRMGDNRHDPDLAEYVCRVEWLKSVPRDQAKSRRTPRLYTTTHVRASLDNQPQTVTFLEEQFNLSIRELIA